MRKIHIVYKEGRRRKVNVSPYPQPVVAGSNPATSSRLLADDARSFSIYKNTDKRYTVPMKNAEASVRMEGCQVTPQMREQCQRVLRGEVTTAELLRRGAQGSSAERTN